MADGLSEQTVREEAVRLLPPPLASDAMSRDLAALVARLSAIDVAPVLTDLIDLVDASALPHLAWQFSLFDEPLWSLAESDDQRRALIKGAIELHRFKGTPWAVRQLIRLLGFGECQITEGLGAFVLDGGVLLDGMHTLGEVYAWAKYLVKLFSPVTNDQAGLMREAVKTVAPARCHLVIIDYREAVFRLDGRVVLDGSYNLGINEV